MPKDIVDGTVSTNSIAHVAEADASRLAQHRLLSGDIVYGRRGDIGRHALITNREAGWLCGTGCLRISLGRSVLEPVFLHYYLAQDSVIRWIANQAIGATLPNLNTSILRSVPIAYPNLVSQRKIGSILSAYDDLIENNTRRIAILEEMAQALYHEWFVNFRFPGHVDVGMVDSQIGPIPDGWTATKLGDVVDLLYGRSLKSDRRRDGPYPVYGSSGIVGFHDIFLVGGPGIVVGRKGNVGTVFWSNDSFFPIDTVYYVSTHLHLHYVYFALRSQHFMDSHAAVPGLSRANAYMLPFVVPPDTLLDRFEALVAPVFSHVANLKRRNDTLRQTRDLLLPRLVSGEIDVSDLDIRVPEAAG